MCRTRKATVHHIFSSEYIWSPESLRNRKEWSDWRGTGSLYGAERMGSGTQRLEFTAWLCHLLTGFV